MIQEIFKTYFLSLVIFLGIDGLWLTVMSKNFYTKYLGHLMSDKPNLIIAMIFYLINVAGMLFFVINPSIKDKSWFGLISRSMLYGLCTYATYDLTNMATLKNWPIIVTAVDIVWGVVLTTVVCITVYAIRK